MTTSTRNVTLLSGILAVAYSLSASAAGLVCTQSPDCASLGYTMSTADCEDGITVKCPTDSSMVFCKKKTAESPLPILYGDGTITKKVLSNKTPIGIVFDETNKLAMAMEDIGTFQWNYLTASSIGGCAIGISSKDTSGQQNTAILAATVLSSSCGEYTAVKNVVQYKPTGCSAAFCDQGNWFIPSLAEMKKFFTSPNVDNVDEALKIFNKTIWVSGLQHNYWSSNEYLIEHMYTCAPSNCDSTIAKVTELNYIRPVISYGEKRSPLPILYGDGTVSNQILTNKTPVGIVFDETNQLAVALTDVKIDGSAGTEIMHWASTSTTGIALDSCTESKLKTCGVDGRANTDIILSATSLGTPYAAVATNTFEPKGCSKDFCKKTKWFLPSMRDWINIYSMKSNINYALVLNSGSGAKNFDGSYWSSNQAPEGYKVWSFSMDKGNKNNSPRAQVYAYTRPVVKY